MSPQSGEVTPHCATLLYTAVLLGLQQRILIVVPHDPSSISKTSGDVDYGKVFYSLLTCVTKHFVTIQLVMLKLERAGLLLSGVSMLGVVLYQSLVTITLDPAGRLLSSSQLKSFTLAIYMKNEAMRTQNYDNQGCPFKVLMAREKLATKTGYE